jgi:hypothetical protein
MRHEQVGRTSCRNGAAAGIIGLAIALIVVAPGAARAQVTAFGMVGVAADQVAILNLVLVGPADDAHPGCRVTASFVDTRGQVFTDVYGNPIRKTFTLENQMAVGLKFSAATVLPGVPRKSVRAVLSPVPGAPASDCTCLVANVEIVEPTGKATLIDYGIDRRAPFGPNPPPPPGPPLPGGCPAPLF